MSIKIYDGHRMPEISLSDYMYRCIKARDEMRILLENAHDMYFKTLSISKKNVE